MSKIPKIQLRDLLTDSDLDSDSDNEDELIIKKPATTIENKTTKLTTNIDCITVIYNIPIYNKHTNKYITKKDIHKEYKVENEIYSRLWDVDIDNHKNLKMEDIIIILKAKEESRLYWQELCKKKTRERNWAFNKLYNGQWSK
jgi:hypothetical protein